MKGIIERIKTYLDKTIPWVSGYRAGYARGYQDGLKHLQTRMAKRQGVN